PSAAFDNAKSLEVKITRGGGVVLQDDPEPGDITFSGIKGEGLEWFSARVEPQLIRQGSSGALTFVSSGPPEIEFTSPLIDIDVRMLEERSSQKERRALPMSIYILYGASLATVVMTLGIVVAFFLVRQ